MALGRQAQHEADVSPTAHGNSQGAQRYHVDEEEEELCENAFLQVPPPVVVARCPILPMTCSFYLVSLKSGSKIHGITAQKHNAVREERNRRHRNHRDVDENEAQQIFPR